MSVSTPDPKSRPKKSKRELPTITIDGVNVTLMPVHGKGNLSAAMIRRMVKEMKESEKEGKR